MKNLIHIGAVLIHPEGTNPYDRSTANPLRSGAARANALRQFKETGFLPIGYAAWNDNDREPITDPAAIDWEGLR